MGNKKRMASVLLAGCMILAAAGTIIMSNARAMEMQSEYGEAFRTVDPVNAMIAVAIMLVIGLAIYIKRNKIS